MEEPRLNFFTRLYYSVAGFGGYRHFLRQRVGKAVIYLLLLAFIIGLAIYIPAYNSYNQVVDKIISSFDTKVPDFTFSNGHLQVSGNLPIILGDDSLPIIIDTSDSPNEGILNNYDSAIMLTKDMMIQKSFANRRITSFSALKDITITKANVRQALPLMKPMGIFIFAIAIVFFVCAKFIDALIVSLMAMAVNSAKKTGLTYQNLFKISVFSMTLPLVVCTILTMFGIPFMWLLFYTLAFVYVFGSISYVRKELDSFVDEFPGE